MPIQAIYYAATSTQIGTTSDFITTATYNVPFFLWLIIALIIGLAFKIIYKNGT
jgi:hypothetical protein